MHSSTMDSSSAKPLYCYAVIGQRAFGPIAGSKLLRRIHPTIAVAGYPRGYGGLYDRPLPDDSVPRRCD